MGKFVYVVMRGYTYEGERFVGVYSTVTRARRRVAGGVNGDYSTIYRARLDTPRQNGGEAVPAERPRRHAEPRHD